MKDCNRALFRFKSSSGRQPLQCTLKNEKRYYSLLYFSVFLFPFYVVVEINYFKSMSVEMRASLAKGIAQYIEALKWGSTCVWKELKQYNQNILYGGKKEKELEREVRVPLGGPGGQDWKPHDVSLISGKPLKGWKPYCVRCNTGKAESYFVIFSIVNPVWWYFGYIKSCDVNKEVI